MKPGDLVHVKNYWQNAKYVPGGTHGIVVYVVSGLDGTPAKYPLIEVLVADGLINFYTADNLKVIG